MRRFLLVVPILWLLVAAARPWVAVRGPDPETLRFHRVMDRVFLADSSDSNGAAWVDVDNDGDEDLFVTGGGSYNLLYRNDGAAGFSRVVAGELVNLRLNHIGTSWADYNNDGFLDLFQANGGSRIGSLIYRGSATGEFLRTEGWIAPSEVLTYWSGTWGDYDNDGFVDLVAVHAFGFGGSSAPNGLWHNNGDGSFTRIVNSPIVNAPFGAYTIASWIDFDQDGDLDLFIGAGPANGTIVPDAIYRNLLADSGRAVFRRLRASPLATDSLDGQNWNFIDIDNDGDLDGYVTNYVGRTNGMVNHLYRNDAGTFRRDTTAGALVTDADVSLGNLWGDFDNDGDLDLFISSKSSLQAGTADRLYRNDLPRGNHWLNLKLVGTRANRAAIGATVRVTARIDGRRVTQTRVISSQDTFGGHNSLRVHVGLGDATVVERLEIDWPGGSREVREAIAADRFLLITEGTSTPGVQAGGR